MCFLSWDSNMVKIINKNCAQLCCKLYVTSNSKLESKDIFAAYKHRLMIFPNLLIILARYQLLFVWFLYLLFCIVDLWWWKIAFHPWRIKTIPIVSNVKQVHGMYDVIVQLNSIFHILSKRIQEQRYDTLME